MDESTSKFWEAVQKQFGSVPLKIQKILDYEGYSPSLNIETLTPDLVDAIEADMRLAATALQQKQIDIESYYGIFKDNPEKFKFLVGEKSCIQRLCKFFEKNGAQKFLKYHQSNRPVLGNIGNRQEVSSQSEDIRKKIIYHYESKAKEINSQSPINNQFTEFLKSILNVRACTTDSTSASVCCPICNSTIKVTKPPGRSWLIGNFIRHCDMLHFAIPKTINKRTRKTEDTLPKNNLNEFHDGETLDTSESSKKPYAHKKSRNEVSMLRNHRESVETLERSEDLDISDKSYEETLDTSESSKKPYAHKKSRNEVSMQRNHRESVETLERSEDLDISDKSYEESINSSQRVWSPHRKNSLCLQKTQSTSADDDFMGNGEHDNFMEDADLEILELNKLNSADESRELHMSSKSTRSTPHVFEEQLTQLEIEILPIHQSVAQLNPIAPLVSSQKLKNEPSTQSNPSSTLSKTPVVAGDDQVSDTNSVLFVEPESQEDIITVDDTQQNNSDLLLDAIREERRRDEKANISILNVMGPVQRVKQENLSSAETTVMPIVKKANISTIIDKRRCSECTKQYRFLFNQGLALDTIRCKLPKSCRECQIEQLHETPSGFWNPEFSPTQQQHANIDEQTNTDWSPEQLISDKQKVEQRALLDISYQIDRRSRLYDKHGMRYRIAELDSAAYDLMTGGNTNYSFKQANMRVPSIKTLKRHIAKNTEDTQEATVMVQPLLNYLNAHQYPLVVALSEDATALSPNLDYDQKSDSLRGLVAPMDEHGIPIKGYFKATSLRKMMNDLASYHVGEYLYIIMATPMVVGASPMCIFYMCSDNRFTYKDVLSRWSFVEAELERAGIKVISNASDGDARLMKAMKIRSGIANFASIEPYGQYFNLNFNDAPISMQDLIHLENKLRLGLLNPKRHMRLGQFVVSGAVLNQMIEQGCKGIHKLNPSDLNPADKMKFDPTLKLMSPDLIEHLEATVAGSKATVIYLDMMRNIYSAFTEDMPAIDRVVAIWTSLFLMRAWRWLSYKEIKSFQNCPTTNAYICLELNAHGLVHFISKMRTTPDQFIPEHLTSQPCENAFRELRSMTTVNHTAVNFTMKDVEQRIRKVQMKLLITHRSKSEMNFPLLRKQDNKIANANSSNLLPSDTEIANAIQKSAENARKILISLGCDEENIDFTESIKGAHKTVQFEFVALETANSTTSDDDTSDTEQEELRTTICYEANEETALEAANSTTSDDDTDGEIVDNLFSKEEALELKRHRVPDGTPYTFKLLINGSTISVKKSYVVWLLSPGRVKRSTDRLQRFRQLRNHDSVTVSKRNSIHQHVTIGDWVVLKKKIICQVTNFQYKTGKMRKCPLTTVPVTCPETAVKRGLWLLGNFYCVEDSGIIVLCNNQLLRQDMDSYVSHIAAPRVGFNLSEETINYLKSLDF